MAVITKDKIKNFKAAIDRGETLKAAMVSELGLSESVAKRGKAGLSCRVLGELMKEGVRFAEIGRQVTPQFQEELVRGKLVTNVILGKDEAPNSLKMLGQDKRVNMFTPDSVAGIVVIESPKSIPAIPIQSSDVVIDPQ